IMAFTDGIEAIAATIMVLELSVPEHLTLSALLSEWPTFFAYIVSFALIYLSWRSHHNAFQKADQVSTGVYLVNGFWLFWSSLVPFATSLIGNNPESALAAGIYVGVVFLWTLTFQFLDGAILKANPDAEKDEVMTMPGRVIIFGGFALAFAAIAIRPLLAVLVLALSNLVMARYIVRRKKTL
ncbi:TMEM175 family protein, partial [Lactobacillus sp.]|uniref:TMEM175 family protein n=1 Tax=Lactobacillus sp. TaxID=1591 RepID=UPI003F013D89